VVTVLFFFSSRGRHTRFSRDWSSDVCSSDLGEPGAGDEGFSGEDGRTTIYDYWGVPEHQKWMNGGAFDGGLLSLEQKQLRMFYRSEERRVGRECRCTQLL